MDKYGVAPGAVESAAVRKTVEALRCWRCDKLLAEKVTAPYEIMCPRCKGKNVAQ